MTSKTHLRERGGVGMEVHSFLLFNKAEVLISNF
jgi:hypothetical protein